MLVSAISFYKSLFHISSSEYQVFMPKVVSAVSFFKRLFLYLQALNIDTEEDIHLLASYFMNLLKSKAEEGEVEERVSCVRSETRKKQLMRTTQHKTTLIFMQCGTYLLVLEFQYD